MNFWFDSAATAIVPSLVGIRMNAGVVDGKKPTRSPLPVFEIHDGILVLFHAVPDCGPVVTGM